MHWLPVLLDITRVRELHGIDITLTVPRAEAGSEPGSWHSAPRMRPEPPPVAPVVAISSRQVVAPALSDYAELFA
jgi:hypothetical protein